VIKSPRIASEIGAKIGSAAVFSNPKAALSTLSVEIKNQYTGKGLYLGKVV